MDTCPTILHTTTLWRGKTPVAPTKSRKRTASDALGSAATTTTGCRPKKKVRTETPAATPATTLCGPPTSTATTPPQSRDLSEWAMRACAEARRVRRLPPLAQEMMALIGTDAATTTTTNTASAAFVNSYLESMSSPTPSSPPAASSSSARTCRKEVSPDDPRAMECSWPHSHCTNLVLRLPSQHLCSAHRKAAWRQRVHDGEPPLVRRSTADEVAACKRVAESTPGAPRQEDGARFAPDACHALRCQRRAYARRLCRRHWRLWRRTQQ